jgi:hypothetical protein
VCGLKVTDLSSRHKSGLVGFNLDAYGNGEDSESCPVQAAARKWDFFKAGKGPTMHADDDSAPRASQGSC